MRKLVKMLVAAVFLCWAGQQAEAQESRIPSPGARAWKQVAEGVWQRRDADGALVTVARGPEGMQWAAEEMERELVKVAEHYRVEPTNERFEILARHLDALAGMRRGSGRETAGKALPPPPCNPTVSYTAAASAGALNSGAWASSSAHFSVIHNYSPYCPGNAYARAHASVTSGGVTTSQTQICSKPSDIIVDCSAYAAVAGTGSCKSDSFAYASYPPYGYYTSRTAVHCGCNQFTACAEVAQETE